MVTSLVQSKSKWCKLKKIADYSFKTKGSDDIKLSIPFTAKGAPLGFELGNAICDLVAHTDPEDDPYTDFFKKNKKTYDYSFDGPELDYCLHQ